MADTLSTEGEYIISAWLDEWLKTYKQCSVKKKTYEIYQFVTSLIKKCPEASLLLRSITEIDLQNILNQLFKKEYSKSTIFKARNTLRQSFSVAQRLHFIVDNPSEFLILPDAPTKKIYPLTSDEQASVENACRQDKLGHLFIFLLRTGLRRSELINLKWEDYNPVTQEISITKSKTDAGVRYVALLTEAQKIIDNQPHINKYIFNCTRSTPVTVYVLKRLYQRLRVKTGNMLLTNHVCRHTFVTRLCEKGVSAKSIAQIIGHAKTDYVMDIYAMIEKKQLRRDIYKLEEHATNMQNRTCNVELPPSLYHQVICHAQSQGLAVDTFIYKTLQDKLNNVHTSNVISLKEYIKKRN